MHREARVIPGQFGGIMGSRRDPWFIEASPYNPKSYGAYPDYEFHFVRGREHNKDLKFQSPNLSLPEGLTRPRSITLWASPPSRVIPVGLRR
jgi:hypothetical protein